MGHRKMTGSAWRLPAKLESAASLIIFEPARDPTEGGVTALRDLTVIE